MKVVVKDGEGKVIQKFWGNLVCVHDLEVANSIGSLVYRINQIWLKERDLSYENKWTAEQLQKFFDRGGYAIQRKFKGNAKGWGTLRSRPTFDNNELARYTYRVMELKKPELKKVYEEVKL